MCVGSNTCLTIVVYHSIELYNDFIKRIPLTNDTDYVISKYINALSRLEIVSSPDCLVRQTLALILISHPPLSLLTFRASLAPSLLNF